MTAGLRRISCWLFATLSPLFAQNFERQLARWTRGPGRADIKWAPAVSRISLSPHQRLRVRFEIAVDGKEIVARNAKGRFLFIVELQDSTGKSWHAHAEIALGEAANAKSSHLEYFQEAFVTPGKYRLTLAVAEPATGKISRSHRTLDVAELANDPLPGAWSGLPAVEFTGLPDYPERWFLPRIRGRLNLSAASRSPLHLQIIANISTSEFVRRQRMVYNLNMGALLPAFKALTQIDFQDSSVNTAVLDVTRRRVIFERRAKGSLDWEALKSALDTDDPNMIDARELKDRTHEAQFFVSEVVNRLSSEDASKPVLVILSGPVGFRERQDLRADLLPANGRVFYFRFQSFLVRPPRPGMQAPLPPEDQLERTLKPLQPRLFDIHNPIEFRKALAAMLNEVRQM